MTRRRYTEEDQERLLDLFGEPERWSQTLRNMHWINVAATVTAFNRKHHGRSTSALYIRFQCRGDQVFLRHRKRRDSAKLPVQRHRILRHRRWRRASRAHLLEQGDAVSPARPNLARHDGDLLSEQRLAVCLRRDVFKRLYEYKTRHGIPTWEAALESILPAVEATVVVSTIAVEKIANAVLYEGYLLYPYRSSAVKNRQRFNFGVVYPRAYSEAQGGVEPFEMETQCLALGEPLSTLAVNVRCLRLVERVAGYLREPVSELPDDAGKAFVPAPSIEIDGTIYESWQEAAECEMKLPDVHFAELAARPVLRQFALPATRTIEPVRDAAGMVAGLIVRTRESLWNAGSRPASTSRRAGCSESVFEFRTTRRS